MQHWPRPKAHPDGRFLINTVLDEAAAPITLIQNWLAVPFADVVEPPS